MTKQRPRKQPELAVYYDTECAFCSALADKIEKRAGAKVDTRDAVKAKLPPRLKRQQVLHELHAVDDKGRVHRNIDAVIAVLERLPRGHLPASIMKIPVIKQVLGVLYKWVAYNRRYFSGDYGRLFWLKQIVILAMLAGVLWSWKLWWGGGSFPAAPVLPFLGQGWLDRIIALGFAAGLVWALLVPKARKPLIIAVVCGVLLAAWDQNRLQPWYYQYLVLLFCLTALTWRKSDSSRTGIILALCRVVMASLYIWAGLQKINPSFMQDAMPWMMEPWARFLPEAYKTYPALSAAILTPLTEVGIGVALLTRFRIAAIAAAIGLHGMILLTLSPLMHNWNSVIWPWNVAMPLILLILFPISWKKPLRWPSLTELLSLPAYGVAVLLFATLPVLSFENKWDSYLSFTLYSNNINQAEIIMPEVFVDALPATLQSRLATHEDSPHLRKLTMQTWSMYENNAPVYPEKRVFVASARSFCRTTGPSAAIKIIIYGKPYLIDGPEAKTELNCRTLFPPSNN